MNDKIKDLLLNLLKEGTQSLLETLTSPKSDPELDKNAAIKELEVLKQQELSKVQPIDPISLPTNNRITKVSPNLYLVRKGITTTFCNEADFNGNSYPLATNSPYSLVYKGQMKNMRGVSLSFPIKKGRIVYPINPTNGVMFGYKQVDVGPGYENNNWLSGGESMKNESGIDMHGNHSPGSILDVWPQVWEDLGLCDFDTAYSKGFSKTLDFMVYEPDVSAVTKTSGNDIPSSDSRQWVANLPPTGSDFFPWNELLRGWNVSYAPSATMIANMLVLVKEILVPARTALGRLRVTNGFRDPDTNSKVGGRDGSLHIVGRAVDLVPMDKSFAECYNWFKTNLKPKIRELVWENPNVSNEHIHVSGLLLGGENQDIRIKE